MSVTTSATNPASLPDSPAISGAAPSGNERTRWFRDEVHAHEPALKAYLRHAFPGVRDIEDVVQESYLRIWRARLARPIASTKSFLFQIARHLVIDGVRRRERVRFELLGDLAELSVLDDRPDASDALSYAEKVGMLGEALASLPARCREIMMLRKFQGVAQREIAGQLGISERTVESQVTRGMKLVEAHLRARGVGGFKG